MEFPIANSGITLNVPDSLLGSNPVWAKAGESSGVGITFSNQNESFSLEAFDNSVKEVEDSCSKVSKAYENFSIIADVKSIESFGYKSTEASLRGIVEAGKKIGKQVLEAILNVLRRIMDFFTVAVSKFNRVPTTLEKIMNNTDVRRATYTAYIKTPEKAEEKLSDAEKYLNDKTFYGSENEVIVRTTKSLEEATVTEGYNAGGTVSNMYQTSINFYKNLNTKLKKVRDIEHYAKSLLNKTGNEDSKKAEALRTGCKYLLDFLRVYYKFTINTNKTYISFTRAAAQEVKNRKGNKDGTGAKKDPLRLASSASA